MTVNVLVTLRLPESLLERIRTVSPEVKLLYAPLRKGDPLPLSTFATTEVLFTSNVLPNPEDAPNLRWVQFHTSGIDHLQGHSLLDGEVALTTTSGIHAIQAAEYVIASILAWAHRLPRILSYQRRSIWPAGRWDKFVPQELRGATIGIVGYGSIGREVARLARVFGMRVLASKRDTRRIVDQGYQLDGIGDAQGEIPDRIYPAEATCCMLPECDYVVLCAPSTPETRHIISEEALKVMKPTAYLVNVGRGSLVDECALVRALQKGWIAGAGLDAFEVEPLSAHSPLWGLDNVILSPHVAGFSLYYDQRSIELFTRNLRRYLEGKPLLNLVDMEIGY